MLVVSHGCGNGLGRTGVAVGTVGRPVDVAAAEEEEGEEEREREVGKAIVEAAVIAEAVVVVSSEEEESEPEPESCRRMCWCGECVEDHNRR